ncbi:NAD(P)H-binding protein [Streptomyces sp. SID10815]|uniref:NAD(P)H-binding protein n=1 Tax=Streptomyces sp. SID10815 TaxID=2706027 RepID=UPI0013CD57D0|nr:NAD(P)H-binding protein [Streptomyces sp. SID10815]
MRIAVVGGTGFIGSRLVERLRKAGHEVSAHSRDTGLDLLTGEGLPGAVEGAEVVVDTIDAPSFDAAATPFFRTTTRNLLDAAGQTGVGHVVLLSIVGIDRVPQVDYYRAKVAQEDEVRAGPVPYSIVRATQFMEFVPKIMSWTADGDTVRLPTTPLQPVAADEVVEALADVAAGAPRDGTLDVAGPDVLPLDELGRLTLDARPDGRRVVVDESAGLFAAVVGDAVTAPPGARLGRVHYTDLL